MSFLENLRNGFNNLTIPQQNGILGGLNSGMYLSFPATICGTFAASAVIDLKTAVGLSLFSVATSAISQMAGFQAYCFASHRVNALGDQGKFDDAVEPDKSISRSVTTGSLLLATSPQLIGIAMHLAK